MKIEIEPYAPVPEGWELTGEWAEEGADESWLADAQKLDRDGIERQTE